MYRRPADTAFPGEDFVDGLYDARGNELGVWRQIKEAVVVSGPAGHSNVVVFRFLPGDERQQAI